MSEGDSGKALFGLLTTGGAHSVITPRERKRKEKDSRQAGRQGALGECPLFKQAASEVKNRWSDLLLAMHRGLLCAKAKRELNKGLL